MPFMRQKMLILQLIEMIRQCQRRGTLNPNECFRTGAFDLGNELVNAGETALSERVKYLPKSNALC